LPDPRRVLSLWERAQGDEAAHAAILKAPEAFLESLAYARSAPRPFAG
jgi:hypothetical protein